MLCILKSLSLMLAENDASACPGFLSFSLHVFVQYLLASDVAGEESDVNLITFSSADKFFVYGIM